MVSKNLDKKIQRKIKRAQNIISEDIPEIQFSEEVTRVCERLRLILIF
jgi:hypothetical protein